MSSENELKDFIITREFAAPKSLVWKCWSEKTHIEKSGSTNESTLTFKKFDFRVGGESHYCQKTSDGSETWGKQKYLEITPEDKLIFLQSFADAEGNIISHPMSTTWPLQMKTTITLEEKNKHTFLKLIWTPFESNEESIATFNGAMEGMKQGWEGLFVTLDEYFKEMQK